MTIERKQFEVSRSPRRDGVGFCFLLLIVCVFAPACGSQRSFSNENDKLRAKNLELEQAVSDLENRLVLREGELRATREQIETGGEPIEGVDPPRLAGIVLGLYSGPIDLDGDRVYDALRVYVRPVDQHGRQITAAGSAQVRLYVLSEEGEPVVLLRQAYTADAFHAAYRSGVTGTHYTLKADLPDDPPVEATLNVMLIDAVTGRRFTAERRVELVRRANAAD